MQKVAFARTLLVQRIIFVIYNSRSAVGKALKLEKKNCQHFQVWERCIPKFPKVLTWIVFLVKLIWYYSLLAYRKCLWWHLKQAPSCVFQPVMTKEQQNFSSHWPLTYLDALLPAILSCTRWYSCKLLRRPSFVVRRLILGMWFTSCSPSGKKK